MLIKVGILLLQSSVNKILTISEIRLRLCLVAMVKGGAAVGWGNDSARRSIQEGWSVAVEAG